MTTTEDVESGHLDRVTALHVNSDGSKLLTASIDHRVKIWNIDRTSGERTMVETLTAHDADIRDAKWLHPSTGTHFATIGNDLKCHIWQEDANQPPNSGRRFRRVDTISSKPRVPFVSLDLKNIDNVYTFLVLIDRQGLLSVYEPTNPDVLKDWTLVDQFNVCIPPPGRGEQTCFKVCFDQNVTPLPYINCLSDDRRQLSLVVTAMNDIKIYRSITTTDHETTTPDVAGVGGPSSTSDASHRFIFYEAARLPTHPALVRDVKWAPFNVRGYDLIATACKDGNVRIYDLSVSESHDPKTGPTSFSNTNNNTTTATTDPPPLTRTPSSKLTRQPQQSSLTTAITSHSRSQPHPTSTTNPPPSNSPSSSQTQSHHHHSSSTRSHKFPYTTTITPSAHLPAHSDAWSILWDPSGQILMSGGADGTTKIWRKGVLDSYLNSSPSSNSELQNGTEGDDGKRNGTGGAGGRWMLFADQAVELGGVYGENDESEAEEVERGSRDGRGGSES